MKNKLMVIDGNSIANRAFYGIRMLNAPDGTPTNAIYGFITILQRLLDLEKPQALCVCFDVHAPTFRHKMYDGYKAQRKPMPEELRIQIPLLKEFLNAMGILCLELAGWEADDLLGTIAKKCEETENWECRLITGDKDSLQLITSATHVDLIKTKMGSNETTEYTPELFENEYGFSPIHMIDLKALMGDSSDNIPGVPGIGEKTALDLLHRFGTLKGVYENIEDPSIKPGQKLKLQEGKASAELSYTLATIVPEAPIPFNPEDALWSLRSTPELFDTCRRFGFQKLIEKWSLEPGKPQLEKSRLLKEVYITPLEAIERIRKADYVSVLPLDGLESLEICDNINRFTLSFGNNYNEFLKVLFSGEVNIISTNTKDFMALCLEEGLNISGFCFDVSLAAYLLDATASHYELDALSARYLEKELTGVQAVAELYPLLDSKLREFGMKKLYYEIELPLCPVLARMEKEGFLVDRKSLYEFGQELSGEINRLQEEIWEMAGYEFNINSPKQLGVVLFEDLQLPSGKKTKTGWSTNADVLEKLQYAHPLVRAVLDYRELSKLKSTYADGLLKVIGPDGRIHSHFQMTVTATGRLSSTEPNLQNIPVRKKSGAGIRRMFTASPGKVLVDADYSQIELRLLAHMAEDTNMINGFLTGEDIHRLTASHVLNIPLEDVTPADRSNAKAVNFGIVYGISAFSLSQDIHVSQAEAKAYIETYYDKYSGVRDYMDRCIEESRQSGYAVTLFGRRRYLPELKSSNFNLRSFGERVARNMPIQGTAADIIKIAMVSADKRLREELPEAHLILQVHDELIVECPEECAEKAKAILVECMEGAASFSVPLTAEAGIGKSWADAH